MEWRCDALRKYIYDIIVGVRPAVELTAKRGLPFLRLYFVLRGRRMKDETLELHLADAPDLRPDFERRVSIGLVGVGELDEPYLRIEIGTNLPSLESAVQPIRAVAQRSAHVTIAARVPR